MNIFQKYAYKYAKQCLGRNNVINEPYPVFKKNMNQIYRAWKNENWNLEKVKDFVKWHRDGCEY